MNSFTLTRPVRSSRRAVATGAIRGELFGDYGAVPLGNVRPDGSGKWAYKLDFENLPSHFAVEVFVTGKGLDGGELPGEEGAGGGSGPGPVVTAQKPGETKKGAHPQVIFERPTYGTDAVGFLLQCSEGATGALTGYTSNTYTFTELASSSAARPHRVHVKLGSVHFKLRPHKPKRVTLKLSRQAKALLKKHGKLKAKFTVKLKNAAGLTASTTRTYTIGK